MKTSVIRHRVADFLKKHPPFDVLPDDVMLELSGTGRVTFHESDELLLHRGKSWDGLIRVIQQGKVEVLEERADGPRLRDVLGEGDILGLGRFLGHETSQHAARTASDVILYSINAAAFGALVDQYPRMAHFLAAYGAGSHLERAVWFDADGPPTARPTCSPETTIREATSHLRKGCVAVVNSDEQPLGLLTDAEMRACGELACAQVMNTRIETAPAGLGAAAYLLRMMQARSRHLLITEDGTATSRLSGVMRDADLELACGRNPVRLLHEILAADDLPELYRLRGYRDALIAESVPSADSVETASALAASLDVAWVESVIRLAAERLAANGLESPDVEACWLLFGRAGRGEVLAREEFEIGVVFADPPAEQAAEATGYFAALASAVQAGRCLPLSAWKQTYSELIRDPLGAEIYSVRSLFDFRPVSGDRGLAVELQNFIASELEQGEIFIPVLANDTLANLPPMTFFRGLVVELNGAERNTLDVARYALQPVEDAARVYSLAKGKVAVTHTLERLKCAWGKEPVLEEAAEAFRVAALHCAAAGFRNPGSTVIDPSRLSRIDQRLLTTAFQSIRRLIEFTSSAFVAATEL